MFNVYRKFRLHEMEAGVIVEVGPDGRGREFCSVGNSFGDQRQNAETILRALEYAFSVKATSTPPTEKSPAERAGTQGNGLPARAMLAGMAMQGSLASFHSHYGTFGSAADLAASSVECADALLAELAKTGGAQ